MPRIVTCRLDGGGGADSRSCALGDDPPSVNDARDQTQDPQRDVDEHVGAAPALHHHWHGRHEERQEVEEDIALHIVELAAAGWEAGCLGIDHLVQLTVLETSRAMLNEWVNVLLEVV
jgi:hypothetical protein